MNILDIIIAVPLIWFTYKGFTKGLIIELGSLVALLIGIYGAINFSDVTASFLQNHINAGNYIKIISFVVTFVAIVVGVRFIAKALEKVVDFASLSIVNKIAGGVFGFLKIAIIVSVLFIAVQKLEKYISMIPKETKVESKLYSHIIDLAPTIYHQLEDGYNSSHVQDKLRNLKY